MHAVLGLMPVLFVPLFPVMVMLAPVIRARLTSNPGSKEQHEGALEVWKLMCTLTGVFLIFLLVQSMSYFREAEVGVSREAGNLLQLDRALLSTSPELRAPSRVLLREYARSVVTQEWPAMLSGMDSPATTAAMQALQDAVTVIITKDPDQAARHEVQKNLNDVVDDRYARMGTAGGSLPQALWAVAIGLLALFIGTVSLLSPTQAVTRLVGLHAAGLAMLAALLFILDGPYKGYVSVSPGQIEKALTVMASRG